MTQNSTHTPRYLSLACALAALCSATTAHAQDVKYGFACQTEFDHPDLGDISGSWDSCTAFDAQMDAIGTRVFYYNLTGSIGPRILEESYDRSTRVEDADIVYVNSHMGAATNLGAEVAGKSWPSVAAYSHKMVLGNEGNGLSVLVLGGCAALAWNPRGAGDGTTEPYYPVIGDLPARWGNAFSGGLRMIVGNWDQRWNHKDQGKWFGYYLRLGYTIEDAWRRSDTRTVSANDTATAATGTTLSNCWSRLSNMTISNFESSSFRRLTTPAYYCQHYWSNDSLRD